MQLLPHSPLAPFVRGVFPQKSVPLYPIGTSTYEVPIELNAVYSQALGPLVRVVVTVANEVDEEKAYVPMEFTFVGIEMLSNPVE